MADFLATRYLDDRGSDNRFYVAPPAQHDRIVRHYQAAKADLWSGDWANCDDGYCLRNLVRHLAASLPALERPADKAARVGELYDVVLDQGFRARQRDVPGGPAAMYDDVRTAVEVGLAPPASGADDRLVELIEAMAADAEVERRGLAFEALVRLAAKDGESGTRRALDAMVRLLATDSPDAWTVAVKAAASSPGALEVFRRAAADDRETVRQTALLYAYLQWRPDDPDCLPVRLYADLAPRVKITGQLLHKADRLVLDFLAGLSITIYINHPDRPEVVAQTAALWYELLKDRLKLHLLNRKAFVKLATPLVAQLYSKRLLDAALFSGLQDADEFFAADDAERKAIGRVVPLFDPASDLAAQVDDVAALLQSPLAISRMVGAMVVAVHAFDDPAATEALVRQLFGRLDGQGRRWALWAFSVLIEKSPEAWVPLLEDLTRTFVEENGDVFLAADGGTRAPFDIDLLPLGLAYGRRGGPMTSFGTLLAGAEPALLARVVRGLAAVGFFCPQATLQTMREAWPRLSDPALEETLGATLATVPGPPRRHRRPVPAGGRGVAAAAPAGRPGGRRRARPSLRGVDRVLQQRRPPGALPSPDAGQPAPGHRRRPGHGQERQGLRPPDHAPADGHGPRRRLPPRTVDRAVTTWAPVVRRHRRLQAVGLFVRLSALGTTLAVVLLGAASVAPSLSWRTAALLAAVAVGFHVFAYVHNDVVDLPIDRTEPRRAVSPLVRGAIAPDAALAIAVAAVPVTLAVAAAAGSGAGAGRALASLVAAFALMAAYNVLGKRTSVPPVLDVVQGLGWGALLLYGAAARGPWTSLTWWLVAFWTWFIVLANGVHGGLRDVANDARCGARTTAILLGATADRDEDGHGRVAIPRAIVVYGWALHGGLVALAVGAWTFAGLGYDPVARALTLAALLALGGVGGRALAAAAASDGDPETLRLAGTVHLLLLMALPVALLLPWLRPGFRAVVVVGFLAPLAALGWLPDLVRWVRRCL